MFYSPQPKKQVRNHDRLFFVGSTLHYDRFGTFPHSGQVKSGFYLFRVSNCLKKPSAASSSNRLSSRNRSILKSTFGFPDCLAIISTTSPRPPRPTRGG